MFTIHIIWCRYAKRKLGQEGNGNAPKCKERKQRLQEAKETGKVQREEEVQKEETETTARLG